MAKFKKFAKSCKNTVMCSQKSVGGSNCRLNPVLFVTNWFDDKNLNWARAFELSKNNTFWNNILATIQKNCGIIFNNNNNRMRQCAGAIFKLDQKFKSWNCLFWLVWCKRSLNQAKNPYVNRVPSKIDFFTIDFTTSFP